MGGGALVGIDPATDAARTFPLPAGKIEDLAAGEGAVWVSTTCPASDCLLRVDPATGRVVARIPGDHLFGQVTVGDCAVWASDGEAVSPIQPPTHQATAKPPPPATHPHSRP